MIGILRFVGVINAAIWLGASVFFNFAVAPAFFTPEMQKLFGEAYSGIIAQMVAGRYYMLAYWCGSIAVVHLLAEWVYFGKPLHRWTLGTLMTAFCLSLLVGLGLQPKLKQAHSVKYGRPELYTAGQKAQASRVYAILRGMAWTANYLVVGALLIYTVRITQPGPGPRFIPAGKFRS